MESATWKVAKTTMVPDGVGDDVPAHDPRAGSRP